MTQPRSALGPIVGLAALAVGVTGLVRLARSGPPSARHIPPDSAPEASARGVQWTGPRLEAYSVTIDVPEATIREAWRDPSRLSRILPPGASVEAAPAAPRPATDPTQPGAATAIWVLDGTRIPARLSEDPDGTLIWRADPDAPLQVEAGIRLSEAPQARGIRVEGHLSHRPTLGLPGHLAAKLRGSDPGTQGRQALKRLKMLLETGEIATARNQRSL